MVVCRLPALHTSVLIGRPNRTKFQLLKVFYLFTRYYSVVALMCAHLLPSTLSPLTPSFDRVINTHTLTCEQWLIIEAISAVLLEVVVEIILILRCKYLPASRLGHTDVMKRSVCAVHRE